MNISDYGNITGKQDNAVWNKPVLWIFSNIHMDSSKCIYVPHTYADFRSCVLSLLLAVKCHLWKMEVQGIPFEIQRQNFTVVKYHIWYYWSWFLFFSFFLISVKSKVSIRRKSTGWNHPNGKRNDMCNNLSGFKYLPGSK